MIKSFSHKRLERFFLDGDKKGIHQNHVRKLEAILDLLDAADTISAMNFPGSGLHLLHPKADKRWAVNVSGNWRVTFIFDNGEALEVDYLDYH